jgi:hypothetical protein
MTWVANQIYASPLPAVIEAFEREPLLADQLFLVDNLEGIRFKWVRDRFFSDVPPENERRIRHGLPERGLLVVSPDLCGSGYDMKDPPSAEFSELVLSRHTVRGTHGPSDKWPELFSRSDAAVLSPVECEPSYYPFHLLRYLKSVSQETKSPIVYYWCAMWGGAVDEEVGWVFDETDHVYQYVDDDTMLDITAKGERTETELNCLQMLMSHVGLHLPTGFFALHEGSFHWERYWLGDFEKRMRRRC